MKQELQVKGMHCNSCEILISEALEEEKGIISVKTTSDKNANKGTVTVEFKESEISLDKIKEVIKGEGYEV